MAGTEVISIYQDQDFYVPAFEVRVGDMPASREVIRDITQVTYRDSLTGIDSFEIVINNWDEKKYTFKYSDGSLFNPRQRVELHMGYFGKGPMRKMLTGEITSLKPSFPSGGMQTLTISGQNLLHSLRRRQETHTYQKMTDNEIAERIARRLGVKIETDPSGDGAKKKHEFIFQYNEYDILFLLKRARQIGYDLFVIEEQSGNQPKKSKICFGPSQNVKRVTFELEYGKTLIEFQPNLTTHNQVGSVTVQGWHATEKRPITVTVNRQGTVTRGVGRAGGGQQLDQAFNERAEIIVDHPIRDDEEAEILARQKMEDITKEMVTGNGSVLGLPDLRAGSVLHICGLGERFSGRYFVTGTTHTIGDGGYLTQFECRREEVKEEEPCKRTTQATG